MPLIEQPIKGNGASYNIIFNVPSSSSTAPHTHTALANINKQTNTAAISALRSVFRQCKTKQRQQKKKHAETENRMFYYRFHMQSQL